MAEEGLDRMQTPPPSFAADIRPLFREQDRRAMTFMFDLWEYDDVRENAQAILSATEAGEMPCDGGWPDQQVQRFRQWVEAGCQP